LKSLGDIQLLMLSQTFKLFLISHLLNDYKLNSLKWVPLILLPPVNLRAEFKY